MDVVNNIVGQRTTNDKPNQDVLISSCSGQLVWEIFHEKSWNVNPLKFWNKTSRDWCLLFKWNFALPVKSNWKDVLECDFFLHWDLLQSGNELIQPARRSNC